MTSYRCPDYDVGLRMSAGDFRAIAGVAFNAGIIFSRNGQQVSGMVIVPQGNEFSEDNPVATAWLWSEYHTGAPVKTRVTITLGNPCDPMLTPEEHSSLAAYNGLTLEGFVSRNWNTEQICGADGV